MNAILPKKPPHPLVDICTFGCEMLIGFVCMFGPIGLVGRFPMLALIGAAIAIALFTSSFRWRSGHAMLPGCLGLNVLFLNAATVCIGFHLLADQFQMGTLVPIAFGAIGIPVVATYIWIVGTVLESWLGPTNTHTEKPSHPQLVIETDERHS